MTVISHSRLCFPMKDGGSGTRSRNVNVVFRVPHVFFMEKDQGLPWSIGPLGQINQVLPGAGHEELFTQRGDQDLTKKSRFDDHDWLLGCVLSVAVDIC